MTGMGLPVLPLAQGLRAAGGSISLQGEVVGLQGSDQIRVDGVRTSVDPVAVAAADPAAATPTLVPMAGPAPLPLLTRVVRFLGRIK